jgi:threonine/homoserine/homoserine lactone efflux protein
VSSLWAFLLVAVVVTLTPGPATATIIRVATRDGRRAAFSATLGNSVCVLLWGVLSAVGVSSLILASQIAYDALRIGGAAVLIVLGLRSLLARGAHDDVVDTPRRSTAGFRSGVATGLANPKLAVFFMALFPQFLHRGTPVLPYALAMAATIVALDLIWFSTLAYAVDRGRALLKPRLQRRFERIAGSVLIALGVRLAAVSR